jgi:AAA15 family ATPase/GTPase
MKAKFKNIGPIQDADLELKDLTIIAGANNTGKTYLAYTLYGFLKMVHHPIFIRDRIKSFPFDPRTVLKNLLETGHSQISIENFDKESNKIIKQIYHISDNNIGIETAHMIRKGQLFEENMPAYKQFMALAG